MARFRSRELDRWATALGVTNDTDAMRVLSKTLVLIVAARTESAAVARSTPKRRTTRSIEARRWPPTRST